MGKAWSGLPLPPKLPTSTPTYSAKLQRFGEDYIIVINGDIDYGSKTIGITGTQLRFIRSCVQNGTLHGRGFGVDVMVGKSTVGVRLTTDTDWFMNLPISVIMGDPTTPQ